MVERQKAWEQAVKADDKAKLQDLNREFAENYQGITDSLNKLLTYIAESPKEAARFTKDQQNPKK